MAGPFRSAALALSLLLVSCAAPVDLTKGVEVTDVTTGWFDGGVVDGKNKLVPSVSFRIRKILPDADVPVLSLNVAFQREGDDGRWEDVFLQDVEIGTDGTSDLLTVRAQNGYTGDPPQSRAQMLEHSQFRDMQAIILGKHRSGRWTELHRVKLERRLLTD